MGETDGTARMDESGDTHQRPENVQVSVFDPVTGDTEKAELLPDAHIILTGAEVEIAAYQRYANGTIQVTIKRKAATDAD